MAVTFAIYVYLLTILINELQTNSQILCLQGLTKLPPRRTYRTTLCMVISPQLQGLLDPIFQTQSPKVQTNSIQINTIGSQFLWRTTIPPFQATYLPTALFNFALALLMPWSHLAGLHTMRATMSDHTITISRYEARGGGSLTWFPWWYGPQVHYPLRVLRRYAVLCLDLHKTSPLVVAYSIEDPGPIQWTWTSAREKSSWQPAVRTSACMPPQ